MFSYSQLLDIAQDRPVNLFLAETQELVSLVEDDFSPRTYCNHALAELVARWCLSSNCQIDEMLSTKWSEWDSDFKPWYSSDLLWSKERQLPDTQWKDPDGFRGFVSYLRTRLLRLFRIDGFIPTYDKGVVRFIPFELDDSLRSGDIVYYNGEPVVEWQGECRDSIGKYESVGCRLQMCPEEKVSLRGASLMLPLRMACWRAHDPLFPRYDVLRVVATGAFDNQNRLVEVGVLPKLKGLKEQFRDAILVGPDGQGDIPDNERRFRRLDCGITEDKLRQVVIKELEGTDCVSMSYRYALRRLPDMHAEVDRENHARWCNIADRLYRMKDRVPRDRDGEHYLQYMIMLVTALCHAGRTDDARKEINCAYRFAEETNKVYFALKLQVNAMVLAQDDGNVKAFHDLSAGISERLSQFKGDERDDLLMRFHGTSMQAHAWGDVFGIEEFSREESLRHSKEALKYAYSIANSCSGSDKADEAESNVAQDLNYYHLWHALFSPGTLEENEAYDAALRHHNDNLSTRARTTNLYHLKRQKSLALLNHWRADGTIASKAEWEKYLLPKSDADGWMVCTNRRHLGALAAADGYNDEAIRYFEEGDAALPLDRCYSPVLASIRFSMLAQAACSLKAFNEVLSKDYLNKATLIFEKFGESSLFKLIKADDLRSKICMGMNPKDLPTFYY